MGPVPVPVEQQHYLLLIAVRKALHTPISITIFSFDKRNGIPWVFQSVMAATLAAAVERALLLLRGHELALHQVHLLLEGLHAPLEREPLCLLRAQRALARGSRLVE